MLSNLYPVIYPVFKFRESGKEVDSYSFTPESYLEFLGMWKDGIIERSVAVKNSDMVPDILKRDVEDVKVLLPSLPLLLSEYLQSYGLAYQLLELRIIQGGKIPIIRHDHGENSYPKPQDSVSIIPITDRVISEAVRTVSRCDSDHFLSLLNPCSDHDTLRIEDVTETSIHNLQIQLWKSSFPVGSFLTTPSVLFELVTNCWDHALLKFPTHVPNGIMTCGFFLENPVYVVEPKNLGYPFGCSIHPDTLVALSTQSKNGVKFARDGSSVKHKGVIQENKKHYWRVELDLVAHVNPKAVGKAFLKGSLPEPTVYTGIEF